MILNSNWNGSTLNWLAVKDNRGGGWKWGNNRLVIIYVSLYIRYILITNTQQLCYNATKVSS